MEDFVFHLYIVDGEFRPDIDESDDEETIAREEEGVDEVRH